jgi:general secretion pathway protein N
LKRIILLVLLFILTFIASVITHLPVSLVLDKLPLPKELSYERASGSVWNAELTNVYWQRWSLGTVQTQVQWSSLLKGRAEIQIRAGRGSEFDYSLKGYAGGSLDGWYAREVFASLPAESVSKQLQLPIPINAQGTLDLTLREYQYQAPYCGFAIGTLAWTGATVQSPFLSLDLQQAIADIRCEDNIITASGDQSSAQVSAEFGATFNANGQYQTQAKFKPENDFPANARGQLSWLGSPDAQGYYSFNYAGRL